MTTRAHYSLFGAAPGTGNLGVDALSQGVLGGIARHRADATFTVFDYRRGARRGSFERADGPDVEYELLGANHSRRLWRGDTLRVMALAAGLGGLGGRNRGVAALRRSSAVLDLSGGDSFTDLYGRHRFETVSSPKRLALDMGIPLVLLPQTYGPFEDDGLRRVAGELCRGARSAWARDARSFEVLRSLVGDEFDPERHRLGVDVAFGLRPVRREGGLNATLERWLAERDGGGSPVVGVNVSGLVWGSPERARGYGFVLDYRVLITRLTRWLLDATDARVALIPHVLAPPGHYESDTGACEELVSRLGPSSRVVTLDPPYGPAEIKAEIARLDWFSGTRMHATIAALSSGVPGSAIAYSPKFLGIFERCDQAAGVADPTALDVEAALEVLQRSFEDRAASRERLVAALPSIETTLDEQLASILA